MRFKKWNGNRLVQVKSLESLNRTAGSTESHKWELEIIQISFVKIFPYFCIYSTSYPRAFSSCFHIKHEVYRSDMKLSLYIAFWSFCCIESIFDFTKVFRKVWRYGHTKVIGIQPPANHQTIQLHKQILTKFSKSFQEVLG